MSDPYDLQRFVDAQAQTYEQALTELRDGEKRTHWMWFVFPQLKQLGRSETARHYGIASRAEAAAYWAHPVLGPRLKECSELLLAVQGRTAHKIMHSPDDLKLRSCMTLFQVVVPDEPVFDQVIVKYYGGKLDEKTLDALGLEAP